MDINQIIKERRSIFPKEFNGETIDDHIIETLLENAHWAPSHRSSLAWKFRVYKGQSKDALFYHWITQALPNKFEKIEFSRKQTSHVIIFSALDKEINPLEEEKASLACAIQNIYLSLSQFPDIGGYWGTGNNIYESHFEEYIGMEKNEHCMGYFLLGKVNAKRTAAIRPSYKENVIWNK